MHAYFGLIIGAFVLLTGTARLFTANIVLLVLQSKERKKILQISIDK